MDVVYINKDKFSALDGGCVQRGWVNQFEKLNEKTEKLSMNLSNTDQHFLIFKLKKKTRKLHYPVASLKINGRLS